MIAPSDFYLFQELIKMRYMTIFVKVGYWFWTLKQLRQHRHIFWFPTGIMEIAKRYNKCLIKEEEYL